MKNLRKIVVYNDRGASLAELTKASISAEINEATHEICFADAADIRRGTIFKETALLAIPGGEDRPYCEDLAGPGTDNIADYALTGSVMAWCAGTYFSGRRIVYHQGMHDEIIADRALGIFPGTIISCDKEFGVPYDGAINTISTANVTLANGKKLDVYFHGGCCLDADEGKRFGLQHTKLIAIGRYTRLRHQPVAIAKVNQTEGGVAILSGVHFEIPHVAAGGLLRLRADLAESYKIAGVLQKADNERRLLMRQMLHQCRVELNPHSQPLHAVEAMKRFLPPPIYNWKMEARF